MTRDTAMDFTRRRMAQALALGSGLAALQVRAAGVPERPIRIRGMWTFLIFSSTSKSSLQRILAMPTMSCTTMGVSWAQRHRQAPVCGCSQQKAGTRPLVRNWATW